MNERRSRARAAASVRYLPSKTTVLSFVQGGLELLSDTVILRSKSHFHSSVTADNVDDGEKIEKGKSTSSQVEVARADATAFSCFNGFDRRKIKTSRPGKPHFGGALEVTHFPSRVRGIEGDILLPKRERNTEKKALTKSTEWFGALVGGAAIAAQDDGDGDDEGVRRAERIGSAGPRLRGTAARREAEAERAPIADGTRRAKAMTLWRCAGGDRERGRRVSFLFVLCFFF